jgi:hypothetical protein
MLNRSARRAVILCVTETGKRKAALGRLRWFGVRRHKIIITEMKRILALAARRALLLSCCTLLLLAAPTLIFAASSSTYTGMFFEPEGVWQQSAGYVTFTITSKGKYSGKLLVGTRTYSFSGYLDANGAGSNSIPRRDDYPLTVQFQVDPTDRDLLTGTVTDGHYWTADMYVDRSTFDGKTNVSPDTGKYTMLIPGDFTMTSEPGGDSYGTVTVDKTGRLRFAGKLADGTSVSQSSWVSKNGQWPLYVKLHRGDGALYGWMLLNPSPDKEIDGNVTWIRPHIPASAYYPNGFAISLQAWGSRYFAPTRGQKVVDLTWATVEFNGGNPVQTVTNTIVLDSRNKVLNQSDNALTLSISTSSGLFSGKVWSPLTATWLRFQGVLLQGYAIGGGYFLGRDQSGEVWLQAPPE